MKHDCDSDRNTASKVLCLFLPPLFLADTRIHFQSPCCTTVFQLRSIDSCEAATSHSDVLWKRGLNQAFLAAVALHSLKCKSYTWSASTQTGVGELELLKAGLKVGSGWWAPIIQAHICQHCSCSIDWLCLGVKCALYVEHQEKSLFFLTMVWSSLYSCLKWLLGYVSAWIVPQMSLEKWGLWEKDLAASTSWVQWVDCGCVFLPLIKSWAQAEGIQWREGPALIHPGPQSCPSAHSVQMKTSY